jgi:hypothetical protein
MSVFDSVTQPTEQEAVQDTYEQAQRSQLQEYLDMPGSHPSIFEQLAKAASLGRTDVPTSEYLDVDPTLAPRGVLGKAGDLISRGQYASAAAMDLMLSERTLGEPGAVLGDAWTAATQEFLAPKRRFSYSDIIRTRAPGFYNKPGGRASTAVLGFIGDVALDPLTYVSLGSAPLARVTMTAATKIGKAGKIAQAGSKLALSKKGTQTLNQVTQRVLDNGIRLTDEGRAAHEIIRKELIGKGYQADDAVAFANRKIKQMGKPALVSDAVTVAEATETAQRRVATMIQRGQWELVDKGGFKFAGKTVVGGKDTRIGAAVDSAAKALRIPETRAVIANTAPAKFLTGVSTQVGEKVAKTSNTIGKIFNRNHGLPDEVIDLEHRWHARIANSERDIKKQTKDIFGDFTREENMEIGKLAIEIDDLDAALRTQAKADLKIGAGSIHRLETGKITVDDYVAERVTDHIEGAVRSGRINDKQRRALAEMKDEFSRLAKLENEAGLLQKIKSNYTPRYYESIKNPAKLIKVRLEARSGLTTFFDRAERRVFDTIEEANAHGFDHVTDASMLYAMRASDSAQVLANQQFNDSLRLLIPDVDQRLTRMGVKPSRALLDTGEEAGDDGLTTIAKRIQAKRDKLGIKALKAEDQDLANIMEHVRFMGEGTYSSTTRSEMNAMLKTYDSTLRWFRGSATVLRTAFGSRNLVSNHFQAFLRAGKDAISFDPRSIIDAMHIMSGKVKGMRTTGVYGRQWTGEELLESTLENNIMRNAALGVEQAPISSIAGSRRFAKSMGREEGFRRMVGRVKKAAGGDGSTGKAADGFAKLFAGTFNFTNVPALLEDYSRVSMYSNLLRNGYSPGQATKAVNDALFDYSAGLSAVEQRLFRRAIPFYSFQRFAVPLVLDLSGRSIANKATAVKAGRALMEVWADIAGEGDATLTPQQRHVLPGYMFDQPSSVSEFDGDMAKFQIFNNFMPVDVMNFAQTNDEGEIDIAKTLKNGALAQLTPFLKVPLETAVDEDFFTGQALGIEETPAGQKVRRNIGDVDPEVVMFNMLSTVLGTVSHFNDVGALSNTAMAPAASASSESFQKVIRGMTPDAATDLFKNLMGWERGIDTRTGKETVYISPYRLHVLSSFLPGIQTSIKAARNDQTARARTVAFFTGIREQEVSIAASAQSKAKHERFKQSQLKSNIRTAQREGRMEAAAKHNIELREWLQNLAEERAAVMAAQPREVSP